MAKDLVNRYMWLVETLTRHGRLTLAQINQLWMRSDYGNGKPLPRRTFMHYRDNAELIALPQTHDKMRKVLDEYNKTLAPHEQIKQFRIVADEWTAANNLLSPTLKLRRAPLMDKYKDLVADIYGKEKPSSSSLFSAFKSVELPTMPWVKKS